MSLDTDETVEGTAPSARKTNWTFVVIATFVLGIGLAFLKVSIWNTFASQPTTSDVSVSATMPAPASQLTESPSSTTAPAESDLVLPPKPSFMDDYLSYAQYFEDVSSKGLRLNDTRYFDVVYVKGSPAEVVVLQTLAGLSATNKAATSSKITNFKMVVTNRSDWTATYSVSYDGTDPQTEKIVVVRKNGEWLLNEYTFS